ncbi:MAG: CNNM domain-containing protein [Planctomycetota bacterium]
MDPLAALLLLADAGDPTERHTAVVLLVVFVVLALLVSSLCSVFEAVLLSITPAYVARQAQEGKRSADRIKALKEKIDEPLAAILTLNTVAHTIGAAGAGAQAEIAFGSGSLGIVSAVLTVLILLVSEIIPKSIGAAYWRKLAPGVSWCLVVMNRLLYPVIWIELRITSLFTTEGHGPPRLSREEISAIAQLGADQGVFEEGESRILKNLFRFSQLKAQDVMTPRTVVFALAQETPVRALVEQEQVRFSRIPIHDGSIDRVTGYVLVSEVLLGATHGDQELPLADFQRELQLVREDSSLPKVFEALLRTQAQIALVVDRFGGTAGIVTLEDLVETLIGLEIVDEVDAERDMQELARREWRRRAKRLGLIGDESEDPLASRELDQQALREAARAQAAARHAALAGEPASEPAAEPAAQPASQPGGEG